MTTAKQQMEEYDRLVAEYLAQVEATPDGGNGTGEHDQAQAGQKPAKPGMMFGEEGPIDWRIEASRKSNEALAAREKIDQLARSNRVDYDRKRKQTAEELGLRVGTLDDEVEARRDEIEEEEKDKGDDPPTLDELADLERLAGDLMREPDILARFAEDVERAGLVGETNNAKILFLTLITRLFDRPVSVAIKGVSSGGKSFTVERVLRFVPSEAYIERTGLSEHALAYSREDFQHRHLVLYEAAGMSGDMASYFIRSLLSEGRLRYEFVDKTKDGLQTKLIEKEGPTGLITTTTLPALHPENETRLLSLGVIDTQDQTQHVMVAIAAEDHDQDSGVDYDRWHAVQELLTVGELRVAVPFATALAKSIPPVAVRLRRDFKLLLTLIRSHALLHRETRRRDERGRIVATLADYAAVRELVDRLFSEGLEAAVPPTVRETVEAVAKIIATGKVEVSQADIRKHLKLDRNSVHHRVKKAIRHGFLINNEVKPGLPARIVKGDPMPDEIIILPAIDTLRDRWDVGTGLEGHRVGKDPVSEVDTTPSSTPSQNDPNAPTVTKKSDDNNGLILVGQTPTLAANSPQYPNSGGGPLECWSGFGGGRHYGG
jgi:hypothetical protein